MESTENTSRSLGVTQKLSITVIVDVGTAGKK